MLYYNLQSKYPGDVTKHCGLTIDEVDSNFYELETMIRNIGGIGYGKTRFYAVNITSGDLYNVLGREMIDSTTCLINGNVEKNENVYIVIFCMDNPYIAGVSKFFDSSLFVNEICVRDIFFNENEKNISSPSCGFEALVEPYGDEMRLTIVSNRENNEAVSFVTVNRGFDIRYEIFGEVVCGGKFVFGEDFNLQDNVYFTQILPESEVCEPNTEIDTEHQTCNIMGHNIQLGVVCDVSKICNNEIVEYDFPQSFDFGLSLVPLDANIEDEYPDARYLIKLEQDTVHLNTNVLENPLWDNMIVCNNVKNLPLNFNVTVTNEHDVYLTINENEIFIGPWNVDNDTTLDIDVGLELYWGHSVEEYTISINIIRGEYAPKQYNEE